MADLNLSGLDRAIWHRFNEGDMARQMGLCPLAKSDLFQMQAPIPLEQPVEKVPFSVCGWREADGDNERGGFRVDERDQAENQQQVGCKTKMKAARASAASLGVP